MEDMTNKTYLYDDGKQVAVLPCYDSASAKVDAKNAKKE